MTQGEAMRRRMQNVLAMRRLALSTDEFPLRPDTALASLPMPVMLVSGARTPPVHAAIFAQVRAVMPQARAVVVDEAGHGVARDRPAEFNALAIGFLETAGLLRA